MHPQILTTLAIASASLLLSASAACGATPSASPANPPQLTSTATGVHLEFGLQSRLRSTSQADAVAAATAGDLVVALPVQIRRFGAAMRAANPKLRLFAYVNGMMTGPANGRAFPRGWYLRDASGRRVRARRSGNYLMNPLSTSISHGARGWTAYVAHECRALVSSTAAGGCFLDVMGAAPLDPSYVTGPPVDPRTGHPFTSAAYLTMVAGSGNRIAGAGIPVMANAYGSAYQYYALPTRLLNAASRIQGFEAEHWFGIRMNDGLTRADWAQGVQMEIDAQATHHTVILDVDGPGSAPDRWRLFLTASYLLGNDGGAWLDFAPSPAVAPFDSLSPVDDLPIGAPTETHAKVFDYRHDGVYERSYSNGKVLVNPSQNAVTVPLGATYTDPSGAASSTVTLAPLSGDILIGPS